MSETPCVRVATYNVCKFSCAVGEFEKYSFRLRRERVIHEIKRACADVVLLQEVPFDEQEFFIESLTDYKWRFAYKADHGIAVRRDKLMYDTRVNAHSIDLQEFGLCESSPIHCITCTLRFFGSVRFATVHAPRTTNGRMGMADVLERWYDDLSAYNDAPVPLVIGGDWNSFPDRYGTEQMALVAARFRANDVTRDAISETTRQHAERSFAPYPYDQLPPEAANAVGKLDHILGKGMRIASNTRAVVLDKHTDAEFAPSDHFLMYVDLCLAGDMRVYVFNR